MDYFYHSTIRNLVVAIQSLFNHVVIKRYDDDGSVIQTIDPVDLAWGPLHKYYMKRLEDGSMKRYYTPLPKMALTLNGMTYSTDRATSTNQIRDIYDQALGISNLEEFWSDVMPSPWDFDFTLTIKTESMQDLSQVLEQILPFFNPSVYLRVKEFNFLNVERDLRVTLGGVSPEFLEEQDEENVRYCNATINFQVDGMLYRPVRNSKVIREIISKYGFYEDTQYFDVFNTSGFSTSSMIETRNVGTMTSGMFYNSEVTATSSSSGYYINEVK